MFSTKVVKATSIAASKQFPTFLVTKPLGIIIGDFADL